MKSAHPPLLVNAHFYLHKNQQLRDKISKSCRKCDPLRTTWGFPQGRLGITTEPAMLAGNRRGFHAIGGHRMAFLGGVGSLGCLAFA
jgi:hypothetical protein